MVDHLYDRFKKLFTEHPDSRKVKNWIACIIANVLNDIPMSDIESINKLSEFFIEHEEIAPGTLKMMLI